MQRLKQFARQVYDTLLPNATATSWSQCGEDMLVRHHLLQTHASSSRLLAFTGGTRLRPGFYVDIGAFSPKRYSNTYWLYRQGWRGITVEPRRQSAWMFRVARPRDVHVVGAVGEIEGRVSFAGSAYSPVNSIGGATGADRDSIDCMRLSSLLDRHLPASTAIDFLSIDCEGGDLGVLRSNDWSRFRPALICVEDFEWQPTSAQSPIAVHLAGVGYRVVGWSAPSVLWASAAAPNTSPTGAIDEA